MRREAHRCKLRARRFAATDGRHRVVRRSQGQPYTRDLTNFALRWDEVRPAIGVALTADQERHYVGYAGSWLSHMRALRQGFEEGAPFVVVLEDDQVLSADFNDVLQDILNCYRFYTFLIIILSLPLFLLLFSVLLLLVEGTVTLRRTSLTALGTSWMSSSLALWIGDCAAYSTRSAGRSCS